MGHMDLVSFISKGVNIYYPMTILLVCFCTYFNIGSRILHCFGVQQFLVDEDLSTEYVNEGKDIVRRGTHRLMTFVIFTETLSNSIYSGFVSLSLSQRCSLPFRLLGL